ncbi:hypothetical protein BH09MYX1_BH09MYX1_60320 [soil metagenome]
MDPSRRLHPSTATLPRFAGATARLWRFVATHDTLAIELTSPTRKAYLVLTGCSHVCLRVAWSSARPELLFDGENAVAPVMFVDGDGVRVACEGATIQDNDPML